MRVLVRPIEPTDEADWRRLWTRHLDFYETAVPEEVYRSTFGRIVGEDPQDFNGFIAELNGQAVGLAHYLFHRHCWRIENVCHLQDLFADEATRGRGVGRALIEAVYAAADEAGAPAVYWLTQDFNKEARKLYDRIGKVTPFVKYQRQV